MAKGGQFEWNLHITTTLLEEGATSGLFKDYNSK
jgi:hypothetical protein